MEDLSLLEQLYYFDFIDRDIFLEYYFYRWDEIFIEEELLNKKIIRGNIQKTLENNTGIVSNRINMTNMESTDYSFYQLEKFLVIDVIENNILLGISKTSDLNKIKGFIDSKYSYNSLASIYIPDDMIDKKLDELFFKMNYENEYLETIKNIPFFINEVLNSATQLNASDIHIDPFENKILIRFRINGDLSIYKSINRRYSSEIASRIKVLSHLDIGEKRDIQDGEFNVSLEKGKFNIRTSIIPTIYGEKICLRLLANNNNKININNLQLGVHLGNFRKLINEKHGLVILTGPTSSGKTTTLYSILEDLKDKNNNILTIEDPVEYKINAINQMQINNKIGFGFDKGLMAALRQDPDVIMIGEIRNKETAINATRAAITGHLVLSTLHTNTSFGVVDRLIDIGVEPYMVASSLKGIISQRLVKILCPNCKKSYLSKNYQNNILKLNSSIDLYRHDGCDKCYKGFIGRRAVYEVIRIDRDLSEAIRLGESMEEIQKNILKDFHSIKHEYMSLIKTGEVEFEEIYNLGVNIYE